MATATTTSLLSAATQSATATPSPPSSIVYYDTFTAGMSTIGIFNTVLCFLVMGILGLNPFLLVALVSSIGAAVGYGLAWVPWFPSGVTSTGTLIGTSIVADIFWCIQEASLSLYSFLIVRKLVRGQARERRIYLSVFWFLEFCIVACRVPIMVSRVEIFKKGDSDELERRINFYHTGYFISIALCESWNAYFLLKKFYKAQMHVRVISRRSSLPSKSNRNSVDSFKGRFVFSGNLYSQLARSSEIRLAVLASIGISRSITYTVLSGPISQLDNFVAAIECLFPTIFVVDILASRLAFLEQNKATAQYTSPHSAASKKAMLDEEAGTVEVKPMAITLQGGTTREKSDAVVETQTHIRQDHDSSEITANNNSSTL